MSVTIPKVCAMGSSQTGLVGTIGVTILNSDGSVKTARATADIYEIGGGCYGKDITFDDSWYGSVKWDTGGGSPGFAVDEYSYSDVDTAGLAQEATVSGIGLDVKRALGLLHENIYIDNTTYDAHNNLISGRVRIYSDAASVGTATNVIATYTITVDASSAGKFTSWKQVEV